MFYFDRNLLKAKLNWLWMGQFFKIKINLELEQEREDYNVLMAIYL